MMQYIIGNEKIEDSIWWTIEIEAFLSFEYCDTALECLSNWNEALDLVKSGILCNISEKEKIKWNGNLDRFKKMVQYNLRNLNLNTQADLREQLIFKANLARETFTRPDKLKLWQIESDTDERLKFLDLYWIDEYYEVGLLQNVVNYTALRAEPAVPIKNVPPTATLFKIAHDNLDALGLRDENAMRDKQIWTKDRLKEFLASPAAVAYFTKTKRNY